MSKKPEIVTITSGYASATSYNDNFEKVRDAFDNTLSLDGSTPNAMNADLDMNSNNINNVKKINTNSLYIGGSKLVSSVVVPSWKGSWVTATSYSSNDMVKREGNVYICLTPHVSGTFSSDLSTSKWELMVSEGEAGPGTGDMLGSNNLIDVADPAQALANIGGVTSSHTHGAEDITSGTLSSARLPIATDSIKGVVEKSTSPENVAGVATDVYPDVAGVKEMIDSHSSLHLGEGQTYVSTVDGDISRSVNTVYTNTTGRPILVQIHGRHGGSFTTIVSVSYDGGSTWKTAFRSTGNNADYAGYSASVIVAPNAKYKLTNTSYFSNWAELR